MNPGLVGLIVIALIMGVFWLSHELFPDMSDDESFGFITIVLIVGGAVIQFIWG